MVGRTDPSNSDNQNGDGDMLECARVCVCACVCASMRACMRDVFAIYDNNILPRLIMIIIKILSIYFIEIAHTDDFPSTGTWLVKYKSITGSIIWHHLRNISNVFCLLFYL